MMKNEQGFTLIEVMVAVALFAVGILAVQVMQYTSVKTNFAAFNMTRGAGQGIDTVERILALDYGDALLTGDPATPVAHDDSEFPATWKKIDDTVISWRVQDDTPMPFMKTIEVDVTSTAKGGNKTVSFTYYKAEII